MSNTNNPFNPPKANVADIAAADDGAVQQPKVFSASGRIGRLRYFGWGVVASLVLMLVVGLAAAVVFGLGLSPAVFFAVYALSFIPIFVFSILTLIQRSHDMDWSGWTVLIALFVPLAILVWLFKPGTPGSNRFGPKPTPNPTGVKVAAFSFPVLFIAGVVVAGVVAPRFAPQGLPTGGNPYGELAEPAAEPAQGEAQTQPPAEEPAAVQPAEQPAAEQQPAPAGTSGTSTQ